jgi:hypothetical protein
MLIVLQVGVALGCCMLLQRAVVAVAAVTRLGQPGRQGQGRGTAGGPAAEVRPLGTAANGAAAWALLPVHALCMPNCRSNELQR